MEQILAIMEQAPKPILIHCKSGSDRTGLVGALYLYGEEGRSAQAADHQLALLYGHIPYFVWGGSAAMDHSFWRFVKNHSQTTRVTAALNTVSIR
jgi:protein tyrosine/serine phosphatase